MGLEKESGRIRAEVHAPKPREWARAETKTAKGGVICQLIA